MHRRPVRAECGLRPTRSGRVSSLSVSHVESPLRIIRRQHRNSKSMVWFYLRSFWRRRRGQPPKIRQAISPTRHFQRGPGSIGIICRRTPRATGLPRASKRSPKEGLHSAAQQPRPHPQRFPDSYLREGSVFVSLYLPPAISTSFRFRCAPVGCRMTATHWPAQICVSITSH